MAEIRIEEKKSPNLLPWILGLLALLLVAGIFLIDWDDDDSVAEQTEMVDDDYLEDRKAIADNRKGDEIADVPQSIENFKLFVEAPQKEMGIHHEYTHQGLMLLSNSLAAIADKYDVDDVDVQSSVKLLREKANVIDNDWKSTKHADHIQEAFMAATKTMQAIQRKHVPEMKGELADVMDQVQKMSPKELTLEQKGAVKGFFDACATALVNMSRELGEDTSRLSYNAAQ